MCSRCIICASLTGSCVIREIDIIWNICVIGNIENKAYGPSDCYMQSPLCEITQSEPFSFLMNANGILSAEMALCSNGTSNLGRFDSRVSTNGAYG